MITETLLISTLAPLYWFKILGIRGIATVLFLFYWLPKPIFVNLLQNKIYPKVATNIKSDHKAISLTFDDIPYVSTTRSEINKRVPSYIEIIKLLNIYKFKATFFIISDYLTPESEDMLINAIKDGHQLGNHGKTNSLHAIKNSLNAFEEIGSCHDKIVELYKRAATPLPKTMVYRPGCGLPSNNLFAACDHFGYKMVLGSVYPNDLIVPSSLINYLYLIAHIDKDDIVILHDRRWTPSLLQRLLPWLVTHGYHGITLSDGLV
jgi:peptidoglycan-N-acetylglucosamine deacetylase